MTLRTKRLSWIIWVSRIQWVKWPKKLKLPWGRRNSTCGLQPQLLPKSFQPALEFSARPSNCICQFSEINLFVYVYIDCGYICPTSSVSLVESWLIWHLLFPTTMLKKLSEIDIERSLVCGFCPLKIHNLKNMKSQHCKLCQVVVYYSVSNECHRIK